MIKKLELTKKQAIKECKELWEEIEASGLSKGEFLYSTKEGRRWRHKNYSCDCPPCHFDKQFNDDCTHCPLVTKYGKDCYGLGYCGKELHSLSFIEAIRNL